MTESARRQGLPTISDLPPLGSVSQTVSTRRVARAVSELDAGPAFTWVQGRPGAGKTTAVAWALRRLQGYTGIKYIACHAGRRIEEILSPLSEFFLQLGSSGLARVLDQRCHVTAKLCVLIEVLAAHRVVVWIDDMDQLEAGDQLAGEHDAGSLLAAHAGSLSRGPGRIVVTSTCPPPSEVEVREVQLERLTVGEAEDLWRSLDRSGASIPFPGEAVSRAGGTSPLELRLLRGILARGKPPPELGSARTVRDLVRSMQEALSPGASELLEALCAYRRPAGRQTLRHLVAGTDEVRSAHDVAKNDRVRELEEAGAFSWVERRNDGGVTGCALHGAVADAVEECVREERPGRLQEVASECARLGLERGAQSRSLWDLYEAYRLHLAAARFEEAYNLQKYFLEDLLRFGYLDLARKILSETVATTSGAARAVALGNLAIVYKNEADYDKALELYQRVRAELGEIGDLSNLARVLHQLGNTHYLRGDLEEAYACYQESLQTSRELGERTTVTATQVQVANVLYELGRPEEALGVYEEALAYLASTENPSLVAAVKLQMGQVQYKSKRYVEAEALFREAEAEALRGNERSCLLKFFKGQALVATRKRDHDGAREVYTRGEETARGLGDLLEVAVFQILRGELERERFQLRPALECWSQAQESIRQLKRRSADGDTGLKSVADVVDGKLTELEKTMGSEAFREALGALRAGDSGETAREDA